MTIAVLALQGAFAEHEKVLDRLGVSHIELRQAGDLKKPFDALILPGGESTVQSKLLKELDMFEPLKKRIENGMPVLATCAGLILLASVEDRIVGVQYKNQLAFAFHPELDEDTRIHEKFLEIVRNSCN